MRTEWDRTLGYLYHGWWEVFTLFIMLLIAVALMGWAANRSERPADRGAIVPAFTFICAYGLLLLLHFRHDQLTHTVAISVAVLLAGALSARASKRTVWLPAILVGALLGLGLNLSAGMLTFAATLVLVLDRSSSR